MDKVKAAIGNKIASIQSWQVKSQETARSHRNVYLATVEMISPDGDLTVAILEGVPAVCEILKSLSVLQKEQIELQKELEQWQRVLDLVNQLVD